MPFAPHIRVTALGSLGTSGERFSYGLNMAGTGTLPTVVGNDATWEDIAADVRAFHVNGATNISARAVLDTVKIAAIGADGKYLEDPYIAEVASAPGAALPSTEKPPQLALAVSLNTTRRGPTGKGRFYLPLPGHTIDTFTFLVTAAQTDATRDQVKTLIDNLNNQPGIDSSPEFRVVVASTKGYNTPVTSVRVGRLLDTVRSRRAQLLEVYGADSAPITN